MNESIKIFFMFFFANVMVAGEAKNKSQSHDCSSSVGYRFFSAPNLQEGFKKRASDLFKPYVHWLHVFLDSTPKTLYSFISALDTRVHFSNERPFRCTFFADFVAKKGASFYGRTKHRRRHTAMQKKRYNFNCNDHLNVSRSYY